jgi:hypothetical protein
MRSYRQEQARACMCLMGLIFGLILTITWGVKLGEYVNELKSFDAYDCIVSDDRVYGNANCPIVEFQACGCHSSGIFSSPPDCDDMISSQNGAGLCCELKQCYVYKNKSDSNHASNSKDSNYRMKKVTRENCTKVELSVKVILSHSTVNVTHTHYCTDGYTSEWTASSNFRKCKFDLYENVDTCYYDSDKNRVRFTSPRSDSKMAMYAGLMCLGIAIFTISFCVCVDVKYACEICVRKSRRQMANIKKAFSPSTNNQFVPKIRTNLGMNQPKTENVVQPNSAPQPKAFGQVNGGVVIEH